VVVSAGLKGIPKEVVEAARIDGANEWQIFWYVTLPMLRSVLLVVAVTLVINSLKVFDLVYVMTFGNYETDVLANRMFKEMFSSHGRAKPVAVVLRCNRSVDGSTSGVSGGAGGVTITVVPLQQDSFGARVGGRYGRSRTSSSPDRAWMIQTLGLLVSSFSQAEITTDVGLVQFHSGSVETTSRSSRAWMAGVSGHRCFSWRRISVMVAARQRAFAWINSPAAMAASWSWGCS
jgi:hypothetical protein